ncbi:MAG: TonB-dependent receptor [Curvibacter sp.]|nr:TonB-dependent receptor [Curvibacter sp.]
MNASFPAHPALPGALNAGAALVAGLLATLSAPAVLAQQSNPAATQLGTVTVSASRGTQLEDMDISTTVIGREAIVRSPETSVDQILNKIPGVFVPTQPTTQLHPTGQVLSIRGFGTSTNGLTLVLLDGIPVNDPYFRTVNWGQIPKDSIERIEIIRGGGATSLWGNMAMGGVINIVTRAPVDGEKHLQASYGSFNTRSLDASLGFAPAPGVTLGLNYDGSESDGYNQTPAAYRNPAMGATASRVNNFNAQARFDPDAANHYFVKLQASQTSENGLIYNIANNHWDTYRLSAGGQSRLTDKSSLNYSGWYQSSTMYTQNASNPAYSLAAPGAGTPYVSQQENASYSSTGATAYLQTEFGPIKDIKAGLDLRRISTQDPLHIFNAAGPLGAIGSQATHQFEGLFVQGTYRPEGVPLDVTLGLRQDFWQADNASTSGNYNGSTIANSLPNRSFSRFDPRLGAKYYLNPEWDLRAAAYRNFSAPGLNQMYRSFVSGANYTVPDTGLQPQTNQGFEFGFDFKRSDVDVAFTAYNNQLRNYIDYSTVQTGCGAANNYCNTGVTAASALKQYVNAGNATLRGFELLGNWRAYDSLSLSGGFSRTAAYLTSSLVASDPVNQQLGQIPLWSANVGATWQASPQLSVTLQVKAFPDYWNNTAHTQLNQGATLADLGVIYKYSKSLDLYAFAQNIGNKSYYDQGLSFNSNGSVNTSGSGTVPALGMPFNLTVGLRASF